MHSIWFLSLAPADCSQPQDDGDDRRGHQEQSVTAECEATLVNVPEEFCTQWEEEKQRWRVYG